jgi:excinuclease ABC subunit C
MYSGCVLPLDSGQDFDSSHEADFFEALPSCPGVLLIEMKEARAQPYVARTADIRRAAERLLRAPEAPGKRLNLREVARRIRYRATGSRFEQWLALYEQARAHFPLRYGTLLRLRPPAVLKVNLKNEYPRCYVTRSIRPDGGFYVGPFRSRRIAESFAEGFLDLFKTRRCQIKIRRDPSFPGCIYSEMKMCLAPCFAGCTKEEYDGEVGRVVEALATRGESLAAQLEKEREEASAALHFERAAAWHKRLEKVSAEMRGLPEIARPIEELNAVILQRGSEEKTISVFPLLTGLLQEPVFLRFAELAGEPRSVESILRKALDPPTHTPEQSPASRNQRVVLGPQVEAEGHRGNTLGKSLGFDFVLPELPEHLSLVARWFYSKPREGEIFFRKGDWPYRRILRASSRLLAPAAQQTPAQPQPGQSPSG